MALISLLFRGRIFKIKRIYFPEVFYVRYNVLYMCVFTSQTVSAMFTDALEITNPLPYECLYDDGVASREC